jgi:glutamine synthetase
MGHAEKILPFSEVSRTNISDPIRLAEVLENIGIYSIYPVIVDTRGRGRGPRVSIRQLPQLCGDGQSTDGSSIPPYGIIHASDVRIVVDPTAVYQLPGYPGVAIGFGNAVDPVNRQPNPGCFRTRLGELLLAAKSENNLTFLGGLETECFLRPLDGSLEDNWVKGVDDKGNYQRLPDQDPLFDAVDSMLGGLAAAGLHITVAHTEVAPRQIEINTAATDLIHAAQDYMVLRIGIKKLAAQVGFKAIFQAKPREKCNGSGLHTHLSAKDVSTDKNALFNADRTFTEIGGHFFGGLYECAPALSFLGNLRQEDWLRLAAPGYEAPVSNAFGWANRTCSFRLTGNTHDSYHVEFRVPSPGSTHAFALYIGMLGAGLWGIEKGLKAPEVIDFNAYEHPDRVGKLPRSRDEAQAAFADCEVMKLAFNEVQFNALATMK